MSYPIHPDDIESHRFGGWADNFNTYREACEYYGADTPEQVAAEEAAYRAEEHVCIQDELEAAGPQYRRYEAGPFPFDDIPF